MLSAQAYSPYGEPLFPDMPTEFGFTGEQTDPLNDLVYLRARHLNPKLGIFGSLDPFEGEMSEPLTWNGYGWVEGNTPNLLDPSGLSPNIRVGCNRPCNELWDSIATLIDEINHRLDELFNDPCYQYDLHETGSRPMVLKPDCYETKTTWESHFRTIKERQQGLKNILNCNVGKNRPRFSASAPISDQNCGTQNALYPLALTAIAKKLDDSIKPGRHGGTKVVVESAIVVTSPSIEPVAVATPDSALVGTPVPPNQAGLNTGIFPVKTPTAIAPLITASRAINPYPYQPRENGNFSSGFSNMLLVGIVAVGAICVAVALTPAVTSIAASAATACAVNPQLCSMGR